VERQKHVSKWHKIFYGSCLDLETCPKCRPMSLKHFSLDNVHFSPNKVHFAPTKVLKKCMGPAASTQMPNDRETMMN